MGRTWLLSGVPRSGTSLCCRLAAELPNVVAASEPIARDVSHTLTDAAGGCELVRRVAAGIRRRVLAERLVPTVHVAGRLDDNSGAHAISKDGLRRLAGSRGEIRVAAALDADFTLLIKHNALFAALLRRLVEQFDCLAIVRNPLALLASWQTVDLPVARGRLPAGEQLDAGLRAGIEAEPDVLRRQLIILNWFFDRFLNCLPRHRILRYEELVATGGAVLGRMLGSGRILAAELRSRNASRLYADSHAERLLAGLVEAGGPWLDLYSESDCADVVGRIRARAPVT